jgi:hypothetical protein
MDYLFLGSIAACVTAGITLPVFSVAKTTASDSCEAAFGEISE